MTNPQTRTRAEIQAEIESVVRKAFSAVFEANPCPITREYHIESGYALDKAQDALEKGIAADLIPRAEHEAAVAEARQMKNQDWSDAATVAALSHKLDANTALKYLVNEYDLDTGHMDSARPRTYPFDHNGHVYEVVVRRKGEDDVAPASPADAEPVGWILRSPAENPWRSHLSYHKPDDDLYYPVYRHPVSAEIDAGPVGYANRLSGDRWGQVYKTPEGAKSWHGIVSCAETAVPLYRHPAPVAPTAVAPVGVVDAIRNEINRLRAADGVGDRAVANRLEAALSRITELPPPSEWARLLDKTIPDHRECLERASAYVQRAALLVKEGE